VKVTREKTENSQAFLIIEMESTEVEEYLEGSYSRLVRKISIPGFRKGKAPRAIVERHIGKESLLEDALDHLLPEAYKKAIEEQEIQAIAQPEIEIIQTDPVVFKATIPLKPTIELGEYGNIRLTAEPVQITEDDINSAMEELRHRYAAWEPVERQVDLGDLVNLDVESNIEDEPFINQKEAQYQVLSDLPFPAPGFAEQLLGMKRDEKKEFKLQFPVDYSRSELSGKEASFKVGISEIKQEILPELNDEFARQVGPDFESLDSLREKLSANLRITAEEKTKMDFEEQVIEAVVDLTQVEFPPILVEAEIARLIDERLKYWRGGTQELEEYLRSIKKTEEELREELHPAAVKRVNWSLVLEKIAEEENIKVDDSEIKAEIENFKNNSGESKDELEKFLNTPQSRESLRQRLIVRNTIQRLVEIAKGSANKGNTNVQ